MSKKILIADDERGVLELVETAFQTQKPKYSVVTVSNGTQLPDIIQKEKPDLLILDILLPGIDGYSLQLQFSQNELTKDIPVIIITALPAARSLFEKFPQVKMFLTKPFNAAELVNKVNEIFDKEESK